MRTSYLPKKIVVSIFLFLATSSLIFGCTSKDRRPIVRTNETAAAGSPAVNINTADASQLEKLPHVGPKLAQKIVEHRTRYGAFRRPEDILVVEGISEERFMKLRRFIKTE